MRRGIALLAVVMVCASAWAQRAVSARAGMIHYLEGRVSLDGQRVRMKSNRFPQMNAGQTLLTAQRARVELLLNPTTFLRVGESSSFKLLSDDLLDTRVALLTGVALVDVQDLDNANKVTVEIGGSAVELVKDGKYHLSLDRVRVYDGEAFLGAVKLTKGWELVLGGSPAKFDRDETDTLYLWSEQREKVLEPPIGPRQWPWVFGP